MELLKLITTLEQDECIGGKAALRPYKDSKGIETLGIGHNMQKPITKSAAYHILNDDIEETLADLSQHLPWWEKLNEVRQRVFANMCFNLGIKRFLGFHHMLAAAQAGDYATAAREMLNSDWKDDVGHRAVRLAEEMCSGVDSSPV